jgi:hypothetical protein
MLYALTNPFLNLRFQPTDCAGPELDRSWEFFTRYRQINRTLGETDTAFHCF